MMARGKIFITKIVARKEIMDDFWYSYLEEEGKKILRVYKQDQQVHAQEAEIGDAFELLNKNIVFVTPMTPPRKDWEAIAWLLGFGKLERACDYQDYLDIRKKKKEKIGTEDYLESTLDGPNFEFSEFSCISGEDTDYQNMACWVDEDITREEIICLIPEFIYPEPFTRKVLKERFSITDEEFQNALDVFG